MLQAWTEVCYQSFGGWQMQTMWNSQKNVWCIQRRMFLSKNVYKWAKHGFAWVEKTVHEVETHWLSGKERVSGTVVSKEGDANHLLRHESTITTDFLEKGPTINSASNCQLSRQNLPYLLNDPRIFQDVPKNYTYDISSIAPETKKCLIWFIWAAAMEAKKLISISAAPWTKKNF